MVVETKKDLDKTLTSSEKEDALAAVEKLFEGVVENTAHELDVPFEKERDLVNMDLEETRKVLRGDVDTQTERRGLKDLKLAAKQVYEDKEEAGSWVKVGYNVPGLKGIFHTVPVDVGYDTLSEGSYKMVFGDHVTGTAAVSCSDMKSLESQFVKALNVLNTAEMMRERGVPVVSDYDLTVVERKGILEKTYVNTDKVVLLVGEYRPPDRSYVDVPDKYLKQYRGAFEEGEIMVCEPGEVYSRQKNFVWYERHGATLMDLGEVKRGMDISDWPTPHDTTDEFLREHGIYQEAQRLADIFLA